MLVGSQPRRVAVIGGARIPFARAHGAYASVGNQEMLTASLKAVVDKFALKGERLGDVVAGAVMKHSSQWNLARECAARLRALAGDARPRRAARLRHQPRGGDRRREQDRARPDRCRHRRRRRHGRATRRSCSASGYQQILLRAHRGEDRSARGSRRSSACGRGTSSRTSPASASRAPACRWASTTEQMARDLADPARGPGRARAARATRTRGARLGRGLLRRPRRALPRARDRQQRARRFEPREAGDAASPRSRTDGTLTAGNSTPLTDGAAAVLLAQRGLGALARARRAGLPHATARPRAVDFVGGEGLLMAPAFAVPRMLGGRRPHAAGLRLLRDPRGVRRAGAVHAEGLGIGEVLPRAARARRAARRDRPREAQREGQPRRGRPPVRRDRRAHRRDRSPSCSPSAARAAG